MAKLITSYKELLAQREAERIAAAEIKALPELTGSEKQIAWALDIRAKKFERLNDMLANMTTTDEQLRYKNRIAIQATKNVLANKTEARFWIDNRSVESRKLIAQNGLQNELKAEFEKLTAEASAPEVTEVDAEEYAVSTEAQDIAVAAEIELATANNAKETIDMTDADKAIAERKTMTRRELFLAAKKEIGYKHNARGAKIWYISYPQYDIRGKYIGHTPAFKRTRKDVEIYLRDNYCGLTVDEFLAEQKAWTDEEVAKVVIQLDIDYKSEHIRDKIERESKPIDDDDDVFSLLPDVDELNDVSEPITVKEEVVNMYGKTFSFINIGGERVTFIDGEVHIISSDKYNAHFNRQTKKYVVAIVEDGNYKPKTFDNAEEFFAEMAKRGACTIDKPEPPVDDYDSKRQERIAHHQLVSKWNAELADLKAALSKMSGKHQKRGVLGTYKLEFGLYVTTTTDECKYLFKVASLPIATYDTPVQVEAVINRLRAAIERGDKEFKFPTIDDLSQEHWDSACDNMPQDYLDAIVAQTMPRKKREPITDAELIANGDELKALEGRIMGRDFPRFEQPRFDAPLVDWYREYQFRTDNPFWWESEYHYNDDGTLIHAKR